MTEKQFKNGEIIFKEKEAGDTLYQILDGKVGVFTSYGESDERKLTELGKDQFFGEMAVIEAYPRSATTVAEGDTKVMEISAGELNQYFEAQPDKIMDIMKHLSVRVRELTDDYTTVTNTIKDLHLGEEVKRSETLKDKIKKFASFYKNNKKMEDITSVESMRKTDKSAHSEGYGKNIEHFSKGTVIFKEGEKGNCMYDIHSGNIGIFKNYGTSDEKKLSELGINQFFGEMGMVDNYSRSATAVVINDDTTIETIYPTDLKELFENNPLKVDMILEHLSYRLRKLTNDYLNACKLVYEVSESENNGTVSEDLKKKAESFKAENIYG
ncbi:MAG: cyclic nucleotide-binding domain-containing protein [Lachnospiraceae bacterium]|nr:cyclic nucleotide-binding domain-containing protein [Lachnospiraceae bacterium]